MTEAVPPAGLAERAARGVFWTGAGQILRQGVQIASMLALARLLAPDDFGVLGMALFFIGFGQLLADFGIGSAVVQSRSDDRVMLSSCFWLNLVVAGVLMLVAMAGAPLVAMFYGRDDLTPLVLTLSLNLLLSGLQVMPYALLYRDMRFAELARAQVLASLAAALVAIALAWLGAGVWALVAQPLTGGVVLLVLFALAARWRPTLEYSWPTVAPLARFSAALLGTNLVGYASRNADSLLVGRVLGAGPLGHYAMAIQLMLYPLQQVSSVIVRVLFPTMVQIKDDLPRLRSAYLKAVSTIALVTFPIMGGLFALADDFVLVLFGPAWVEMAPVLKVLAWVGMMQSVGTTVGSIYLCTGTPGIALRVTLIGAPMLIGGMVVGLPWGILGVAIGYASASFLFFYYTLRVAFRVIDLDLRSFHRVLVRPLLATLMMVATLVLLGLVTMPLSPTHRLLVGVAAGLAVYGVASLAINRAQLTEVMAIVRGLRRRS